MNNEELKPCPICGGEAHTFGHTKSWGVLCTKCYISTLRYETEAAAIAAWNKRTNPDAANFSYSKKSNNSELGNYPEKQDSLNELVEFVRFCADASTGCIVYINNRARDIIAKSKEKRVCVKQNAEKLDTKSVASNQLNAKLTYADVEKMVKPLEWEQECEDGDYIARVDNGLFRVSSWDKDKYSVFFDHTILQTEDSLKKAKQAAQEFLVDLVAAALGVERSGE